jgi:hypothetical protein
MAEAYNPSFLARRDQEDHGSRPAWEKSSPDLYLNQWLGALTHICHSSYSEKHKQEDCGSGWPPRKKGTLSQK